VTGVTLTGLPRIESDKLSAVFALLLGQLSLISHHYGECRNFGSGVTSVLFAGVCSGRFGVK
jgi:hypothetical protein